MTIAELNKMLGERELRRYNMEKLTVSATEAAKLLGTRPDLLLSQLERGEIPAYREGKNWKVPVDLLKTTVENRAIREAKERRRLYEEAENKTV